MTPGAVYLAPPFYGGDAPLWRVSILSKPCHGTILIRWLDGPFSGREARLDVKTLRKVK